MNPVIGIVSAFHPKNKNIRPLNKLHAIVQGAHAMIKNVLVFETQKTKFLLTLYFKFVETPFIEK